MGKEAGKYTVLHHDDTHFLMRHPDGSDFRVAKNAIEPITRGEIQRMADGEEVLDPTIGLSRPEDTINDIYSSQSSAAPMPAERVDPWGPPRSPSKLALLLQNPKMTGIEADKILDDRDAEAKIEALPLPQLPSSTPPAAAGDQGEAPPASGVTTATPVTTPTKSSAVDAPQYDFQKQQLKGLEEKAKVEAAIGEANARNQEELANNLIEAHKTSQAVVARRNEVSERLMNEIYSGKIDPNHYWESKDTGGRITSAIALVIGGIGAGLSHGNNLALETINKAIDRDIDSQKANLANKNSLLAKNLEMTHDMISAEAMTRSDLMSIATAQAGKIAGQYATPMAKANLDLFQGALKGQITSQNYEIGQRAGISAFISKLRAGGSEAAAANPARTLEMMKLGKFIDDKQYEKASEELGNAEKTQAAHNALDRNLPQIAAQQKTGNRILNPIQSAQRIASLRAELIPLIMEANPSKRLTHDSLQAEIDPLIQKWSSNKETTEQMEQSLHRLVDTHSSTTPILNGIGINLPAYKKTPPIQTGGRKNSSERGRYIQQGNYMIPVK